MVPGVQNEDRSTKGQDQGSGQELDWPPAMLVYSLCTMVLIPIPALHAILNFYLLLRSKMYPNVSNARGYATATSNCEE